MAPADLWKFARSTARAELFRQALRSEGELAPWAASIDFFGRQTLHRASAASAKQRDRTALGPQFLRLLVRNFIRSRGYDVVRGPNLHDFLRARGVDLVVDVGANDGGYGAYLRRWGYSGKILSLEPTSRAFARLGPQVARDPNWEALQLAAGPAAGTATIKVSRDDRFSSFHALSEDGLAYDPAAAVIDEEIVEVVTLDALLAGRTAARPFLKIDTQGFERAVMEGASAFLQRCVGVQLELPIQKLYVDMWSFSDALAFMHDRGFILSQTCPTNPRHDDPQSVAEFDCVFRPI
jgi:FkbM family methyltransferase